MDNKKKVWWRQEGTDVWVEMAGECRRAKFVVNWLKMTKQWKDVRTFVENKARHLTHLSDEKLLQKYLSFYPEPIPLKGDAHLYIHQSSSNSIVAKMRNAKFLAGLAHLRTDFRRQACPGGKTDWYLHPSLNEFNCCIVGEEWEVEHLPEYMFEVGGSVGGMGTCSILMVNWPLSSLGQL